MHEVAFLKGVGGDTVAYYVDGVAKYRGESLDPDTLLGIIRAEGVADSPVRLRIGEVLLGTPDFVFPEALAELDGAVAWRPGS